MSLSYQESLSALMDNEADDLELRRLCKVLEENDPGSEESVLLQDQWKRYNLAKLLIHGEFTGSDIPALSSNFSGGVMAAIEGEPEQLSGQLANDAAVFEAAAQEGAASVASASDWKQNIMKLAVAASVAAVAVVVLQAPSQPGSSAPGSTLMAEGPGSSANASQAVSTTGNAIGMASATAREVADIDPEAHQRLLDYIDSMSLNLDDEPIGFQRLEDSPLLRMVNEIDLDN